MGLAVQLWLGMKADSYRQLFAFFGKLKVSFGSVLDRYRSKVVRLVQPR